MGRVKHTAEDHRIAFEAWYAAKYNYQKAADAAGTSYQTVFRWSEEFYVCMEKCPWHNWDKLKEERERATAARMELIEQGNFDPIAHAAAMQASIKDKAASRRKVIRNLVRSDIERLAHLELIYAKVFFETTGVPLDYTQVVDPNSIGFDPNTLMKHTLEFKNAEGKINALIKLIDAMRNLKISAGLLSADGVPVQEEEELTPQQELEQNKPLTIEDLRKIREKLAKEDPHKLAAMASIIQADDNFLEKADVNSDG